MITFEVDKTSTYILAGNYGADSMALTDMLIKQDIQFVLCFVNYHLGEEWESSENNLREFCKEHNVPFETCDANGVDQTGKEENFEKWARHARYAFFEEMYKKYDAAGLFIPHQQDDVIENYIVAKKTGITGSKFGLNPVSSVRDMFVLRPLINFSREDLERYCKHYNVPYDKNFHNYQQDASKSDVRRNIVNKLSDSERELYAMEIKKVKSEVLNFAHEIKASVANVESLNIRELFALSEGEFADTIVKFVKAHSTTKVRVTPKTIAELRKMCLDPKPNMTMKISGSVYFVKEYDEISIDNDGLDMPYHYVINEPCEFHCETFDMDFREGAEDRNIKPEDYPITVRSILPGDFYTFSGYSVRARQMLIAAGISERLLHVWPVFLNKDGKIIYIPRYKKGFSEYHKKSRLTIHVKEEEK